MAKTRRLIGESLPFVDLVTEIVDARAPFSTANPELGAIIGKKPRIVLLNKCDLADEKATSKWLAFYKNAGIFALAADCRSGKGLGAFLPLVRSVLKDRIERNVSRGMAGKSLRVMVVGIPNTGKSSFINRLAGSNRAAVADRPGVTKQNNWFPVAKGIELLDTPGVLWPKFDDPAVGDRLSFLGSVKDDVVDTETIALRLIAALSKDHASLIEARYHLEGVASLSPETVLEQIGRKRGALISGGEVNIEKVSAILLDEFRGGKLGRITLELPG